MDEVCKVINSSYVYRLYEMSLCDVVTICVSTFLWGVQGGKWKGRVVKGCCFVSESRGVFKIYTPIEGF